MRDASGTNHPKSPRTRKADLESGNRSRSIMPQWPTARVYVMQAARHARPHMQLHTLAIMKISGVYHGVDESLPFVSL